MFDPTHLVYISALLGAIAAMTLIDWRYKLAYFAHPSATALTLAVGVAVLSLWDILGIRLGIFFSGQSAVTTGLFLAPNFPVEEFFFLYFLCYFSLILYRLLEKRWPRI